MIHQLISHWHSNKNIRLILGFSLILLVCLSINDVFAATGKPCTLCHPLLTPETEIQVTEWKSSGHAKSLETLKASPDAEDACLKCHTADYVFDENITLDNATLNNDCAVCHEDHISLGITADVEPTLLKPKNELCNDCHSASSGIPGEKPRSAQFEIFTGTGGIGVADSPSLHGEIIEDGCVTCHAPSVETETGRSVGTSELETLARKTSEGIFGKKISLLPGALSGPEKRYAAEYQEKYTSDTWFYENSERMRFKDVPPGVVMVEGRHKAPAGLIRVTLLVRGGRIHDLIITGDFHPSPYRVLKDMEESVRGKPCRVEAVDEEIARIFDRPEVEIAGTEVGDFSAAFSRAFQVLEPRTH